MQGFGNAGQHIAKMLKEIGFKVVAISDSSTGIYDENGLNIEELIELKNNKKSLSAYERADKISNEKLLELNVEILVPAALGGVINVKNKDNIKAKTILELANSPITPGADITLNKKNIEIIPDILANAGGVIVSYFEWVQNLANYYWSAEEVEEKLKEKILNAYREVLNESKMYGLDLRTASFALSINRILDAEKMRGSL